MFREFGKVTYPVLYSKCVTNQDLQYSRGKSIQCYVAAHTCLEENGYMYMHG